MNILLFSKARFQCIPNVKFVEKQNIMFMNLTLATYVLLRSDDRKIREL